MAYTTKGQLNFIHSIRAFCALYVTFGHAYLMFAPKLNALNIHDTFYLIPLDILATYTRAMVAIFIVISGYCLMHSIAKSNDSTIFRTQQDWRDYFTRRFKRILPPFYASLVLSILLILLIPGLGTSTIGEWSKSFPAITTGSILSHIFLVHNYGVDWQYSINHPMWSIATEFQLYFLFPLFVIIWGKYGYGKLLITCLAVCMGLILLLVFSGINHNPWPPQFVALFGFGMCAALTSNDPHSIKNADLVISKYSKISALLLILTVLLTPIMGQSRQQIPDFLIGGATAYALVHLTLLKKTGKTSWLLKRLESRRLSKTGLFSYSLYLTHAPVLAAVYLIGTHLDLSLPIHITVTLVFGGFLALTFSYYFYLLFEKPFIAKR